MIVLNGAPANGHDGSTILALLDALGVDAAARGVAVAVGDEVVPRAEWPITRLADGARVEVLTAMQGG